MKNEMVRCADVLDVRDGTHDSPKYVLEGYPLITSKNIKNGNIEFDNVNYISKDDFEKINLRSKVDNGDILMPMIGTIGNPVIVNTDREFAIKNVALFKFDKSCSFNNRYIYYALRSPIITNQLDSNKRGGTQSFVSLTNIRDLKIPNLCIDMQKKVVNVLDKVEQLMNKRKKQIEACDELIKSQFIEMFGSIHENKMYPYVSVKEITSVVSGGTPNRDIAEYWSNGTIGWVKTTELKNNIITEIEESITQKGLDESSAKIVPKGTILIAMYGQGKTRGMTAYLDIEAATNQACACIIPSDKINQKYLWYYFILSYEKLRSMAKGGNQPNLNGNIIKNFLVLLPPVELQNQFVSFVQQVDKLKFEMEQSLIELENNFNSLMQRAFKGELF